MNLYLNTFIISRQRLFACMAKSSLLPMFIALLLLTLSCTQPLLLKETHRGVMREREVVKGDPIYKIGNPYKIRGKTYTPQIDYSYKETGVASWYGPKFHNRRTANNEIFDENFLTAAHRTLPLPSYVLVTNLQNNRSVRLRVNDRGPFAKGRIIDLSRQGARVLGYERQGTTLVHVQILPNESKLLADQMKRGGKATLFSHGRKSKLRIATDTYPQLQNYKNSAASRSTNATDGAIAWKLYAQVGAFREQQSISRARARLQPLQLGLPVIEKSATNPELTRLLLGPLQQYNDTNIENLLDTLNKAGFTESQLRVLR